MLAATQLTADGVFDAQEAETERVKAKAKLHKVRCSGASGHTAHANVRVEIRLALSPASERSGGVACCRRPCLQDRLLQIPAFTYLASSRWLAQAKADFKAEKAQNCLELKFAAKLGDLAAVKSALDTGVRADCRGYWVGACT